MLSRFLAAVLLSLSIHFASSAPSYWGPDPQVFDSHMVLAPSDVWSGGVTPAKVWGVGTPGEYITVSGLPQGALLPYPNPFLVDSTGNFSFTITIPSSMTPYQISFNTTTFTQKGVVLDDVMFGHTFLCRSVARGSFIT